MKKLFLALIAYFLPVAVIAAVVTTATVPPTRTDGTTITATIWNNDVQGIYSYINNNIVAALNTLTTKGDIYVYDGSALQRLGVGTNNYVLTADSAQATGLKWAALANTTGLTTKGDLLVYSTTPTRLPVGSNNQVLIADSTTATGLKWDAVPAGIPTGSIIAWSPTGAGTNTVPSGWTLCDGTAGAPNLIGKFVIGTRPPGSSAAANSKGYGAYTADGNGGGVTTHSHTASISGTTSGPSPNSSITTLSSGSGGAPTPTHTHTFSASASTTTASTEPADYALVYIMKL